MRNEVGEISFYYRRRLEKWNPFILLCKRHSSVFRVLSKCGLQFSLNCCKVCPQQWTQSLPIQQIPISVQLLSVSHPENVSGFLSSQREDALAPAACLRIAPRFSGSQPSGLSPSRAQTFPLRCHLLALSCKSSSFYPCSTVQSGNLLVLFPECPFSLVSVDFSSFFPSGFQPLRLP